MAEKGLMVLGLPEGEEEAPASSPMGGKGESASRRKEARLDALKGFKEALDAGDFEKADAEWDDYESMREV